MDRRVIGERSDAVLRPAMPGGDTAVGVTASENSIALSPVNSHSN